MIEILPWALFLLFVFAMLALDLGVFHRSAHEVKRKEALIWSGVWIGLSIAFNIGVYYFQGTTKGLEWTTGYLIEKSLSIDNVFLFILIFGAFQVPAQYQHRVLFWGILGALVMRGVLIAAGAAVLSALHVTIYLFGAFLIFTGIKFLLDKGDHTPDLDKNLLVRIAKRFRPVTEGYEGQKFFVRRPRVGAEGVGGKGVDSNDAGGKSVARKTVLWMTPLFLVLLLIESTDLVFAVDSIPAIFAVTEDPFIVFTSNIFAILGLRALYFVLNGYLAGLPYLKPALAAILVFVGTKMLLVDVYKINPLVSLAVIAGILSISIVASLFKRRHDLEHGGPPTEIHPVEGG